MRYENGTLGHEVIAHQNAYGFDADQAVQQYTGPLPSASILVPYYNAQKTINRVIEHILQAVSVIIHVHPGWHFEIILIDDGSDKYPAGTCLDEQIKEKIRFETIKHQGRCFTRNYALSLAKNQVILFVDSDVLIHPSLLLHHLSLHAICEQQGKGCISFALFDFHSLSALLNSSSFFKQPSPNDWRIRCLYQEEWCGCEQDKRFAGKHFQPLTDTNRLQNWPQNGFYGPWVLPNMVLGGFFTMNREKALAVGGCAPLFDVYAFEETSLVTRLIAFYHDYVIPLTEHFAIHIEDTTIGERREDKYKLFRNAHFRYFELFLVQKLLSL